MRYRIRWESRQKRFASSEVEANSPQEARELALKAEDTDFEEEDYLPDWEIKDIRLIPFKPQSSSQS